MTQTTNIKISQLTSDLLDQAALVVAKAITREPMTKVLGLNEQQVHADLVHVVKKLGIEGLSLVAIDQDSDEIIGVALNKDYTIPPVFADTEIADSLPIFTLLGTLNSIPAETMDAKYGEVFHLFILAIDADSANQSVGSLLCEHTLNKAQLLGYQKVATETTGPISQHIARNKFAAREVAAIKYADFAHGGSKPFSGVKEVDGCYMFIKDLN